MRGSRQQAEQKWGSSCGKAAVHTWGQHGYYGAALQLRLAVLLKRATTACSQQQQQQQQPTIGAVARGGAPRGRSVSGAQAAAGGLGGAARPGAAQRVAGLLGRRHAVGWRGSAFQLLRVQLLRLRRLSVSCTGCSTAAGGRGQRAGGCSAGAQALTSLPSFVPPPARPGRLMQGEPCRSGAPAPMHAIRTP